MLRAEARKRRAALAGEERRALAGRIAGTGLGFAAPAPDAVIAGYYPIRDEIDCLPLMDVLAAQGRVLALPFARDDGLLDFIAWRPGEALRPGPFNIPYPADGAVVLPVVLLVPLLAFDARGHRLGYGGGNYDRTLERLRARQEVTAIGLAYDFQEAERLPCESHDQLLDWVLTPAGPRRLGD
jgi:5-formyltetrahydrofolate cyclo-ligase